jgi:hypothetical protein
VKCQTTPAPSAAASRHAAAVETTERIDR